MEVELKVEAEEELMVVVENEWKVNVVAGEDTAVVVPMVVTMMVVRVVLDTFLGVMVFWKVVVENVLAGVVVVDDLLERVMVVVMVHALFLMELLLL